MKIASIKKAVENYSIPELKKAEENLMEEQPPEIDIDGDDEGEKLTHILAALWIKEQMQKNNSDFRSEVRNYSQKVRTSIS
jgi:homoserine dehydrogenase